MDNKIEMAIVKIKSPLDFHSRLGKRKGRAREHHVQEIIRAVDIIHGFDSGVSTVRVPLDDDGFPRRRFRATGYSTPKLEKNLQWGREKRMGVKKTKWRHGQTEDKKPASSL